VCLNSTDLAITTTVSVTADIAGEGEVAGPLSMGTATNTASPASFQVYQLVQGDIAFVLPLGYTVQYLFIDPIAATSGCQLVLKGNVNDVGVVVSSALPSLIPVSGTNPFVGSASSAGSQTVDHLWVNSSSTGLLNTGWC
jgi:hypothetical protein